METTGLTRNKGFLRRHGRRLFSIAALILLPAMLAGCGGGKKPGKATAWALAIKKTTDVSIEVDIVGVDPKSKTIWESYNIDNYWKPGDPLRAEQLNKFTLNLAKGETNVVEIKDAQWKKWLEEDKATELVVIADLPGTHPGGAGDPRRVFLPLEKGYWKTRDSDGQIVIEVRQSQVKVLTLPR